MRINYKPTIFRSEVNVKHKNPLQGMLRLLLTFVVLATGFYVMLGLFIEETAARVTPRQEQWLWQHMRVGYNVTLPPKKKKFSKMRRRLDRVFAGIPKDRLPVCYNYQVLLDYKPFVNAFAVPGGTIVVTTGLMEMFPDDRTLTFVLGHELGHFQGRHHLIGLERLLVMTMASKALFGLGDISGLFAKMTGLFNLGYSRQQELEADRWGIRLLKEKYGGDDGARMFFDHMNRLYGSRKLEEFFSTHPSPVSRMKHMDKRLQKTPKAKMPSPAVAMPRK